MCNWIMEKKNVFRLIFDKQVFLTSGKLVDVTGIHGHVG